MRRNRALAVCTTAVVLATGMSACGSSEDPGELDVWIGFPDYRLDWVKDVAKDFEKRHPEYSINVEGFETYEVLWDKLQAANEQGEPPDIVQNFEAATVESRDVVNADEEPLFRSIDEAIDGRKKILDEPVVVDDVVKPAKDYYTVDGEYTSMPWNTSTPVFYTNTDLMKKADIDSPPKTWQELQDACDKIDKLKDGPKYCATWPNQSWFFEQPLAQQGETLVNNDNGRSGRATKVDVSSPEFMSFVDVWAEMADNEQYVYSGKQEDWEGPRNAFTGEEVAFMMTSSGEASIVADEADKAGFDFEVSELVGPDKGKNHGTFIGGATLWLTNGMEKKKEDGALAFMQFLNNPENAADWHKKTGYIPITNEANKLLEKEGWFEENPYHSVAMEQLDKNDGSAAATGPLVGNFVAIRAEMTQAMEDIMTAGDDPDKRFKEAQKKAQDLLDEYNEVYVG